MQAWGTHHLILEYESQIRVLKLPPVTNTATTRSSASRAVSPQELEAFYSGIRAKIDRFDPDPFPDGDERKVSGEMIPLPGGFLTRDHVGEKRVPPYRVRLEAFRMNSTPVSNRDFANVYLWAVKNGYSFSLRWTGGYNDLPYSSRYDVSDDMFLYCNARSEMEGLRPAYHMDPAHTRVFRGYHTSLNVNKRISWTNAHVDWNAGYRLPTESEWEYAARNADPEHRHRFPWGDTLSHEQANYLASNFVDYDHSDGGVHPAYAGQTPPLAPVKAFPPHGFQNRFHQLIGNLPETVWNRKEWIAQGAADLEMIPDPDSTLYQTLSKGGGWANHASESGITGLPPNRSSYRGFLVVLPGKAQDLESETP